MKFTHDCTKCVPCGDYSYKGRHFDLHYCPNKEHPALSSLIARTAAWGWGVLLDRWHDEGHTAHLLQADNSPACGTRYYTATRRDVQGMTRCKRCERLSARSATDAEGSAGE